MRIQVIKVIKFHLLLNRLRLCLVPSGLLAEFFVDSLAGISVENVLVFVHKLQLNL